MLQEQVLLLLTSQVSFHAHFELRLHQVLENIALIYAFMPIVAFLIGGMWTFSLFVLFFAARIFFMYGAAV